jgi:hypothetical protein
MKDQVGFGKAQYALVSTLSLLLLSVGGQMMAQGLTLPLLKKQWKLSTLQEAVGFMIMNIGIPLGSVLQFLSDTFGRKTFILIDLFNSDYLQPAVRSGMGLHQSRHLPLLLFDRSGHPLPPLQLLCHRGVVEFNEGHTRLCFVDHLRGRLPSVQHIGLFPLA